MKKFLFAGICLLGLGACASIPVQKNCAETKIMPSLFAEGKTLVAFYMQASRKQYGLDGVLEIKKLGANQYEINAFSAAGGYRLLQAIVTPDKTQYQFLIKQADKAVVRAKLQRMWTLLLFQPESMSRCQRKEMKTYISYQAPFARKYIYEDKNSYPEQVLSSALFNRTTLFFKHYQTVAQEQVPDVLEYQDGAITVQLQLIRLK